MSDRPTIRQVAERAGVSIATASRALNDRGDVSAETRARVRAAATAAWTSGCASGGTFGSSRSQRSPLPRMRTIAGRASSRSAVSRGHGPKVA